MENDTEKITKSTKILNHAYKAYQIFVKSNFYENWSDK